MAEPPLDDEPLSDELEHADELLEKAEALIRKHQGELSRGAIDDLPVLTDVVDAPAAPAWRANGREEEARARLVERLAELDTVLSQAIECWVAEELPQILSREFDAMNERIREQAVAHLRATLYPELSNEVADLLDLIHPRRD